MNELNEKEAEILEYLEEAYSGAKMANDPLAKVRIARAIAAFQADPTDAPAAIFSTSFLEKYYMV